MVMMKMLILYCNREIKLLKLKANYNLNGYDEDANLIL